MEGMKYYRNKVYTEKAVHNFPKEEDEHAIMVTKIVNYYDIVLIKSFWQKLLKVIMSYLTLDGFYTRVYGNQFVNINHFCHGMNISFPFYLMSYLRIIFSDHHKNPSKFPILHEGLLVLIDAHFHGLPPPKVFFHNASKNKDTSAGESDNEASGFGSKEDPAPCSKKAKIEKPSSSKPKVRKGLIGKNNLVSSSSSTFAEICFPSSSEKDVATTDRMGLKTFISRVSSLMIRGRIMIMY